MIEPPTRILVIDDEAPIRSSLGAYLEDCGYLVQVAANGREGLERFETDGSDLILCDLRMPEVDGLEVLARIREASPETPVVVISGTGDISDSVRALHLGAWDFLLKPIEDLTLLDHTLAQVLERARLRRENLQYREQLENLVRLRTQQLEDANENLRRENDARQRDILALEQAQRAEKQLRRQLVQSQKMEAVGTLAGGIAHDFNNILSAMLGYLELARYETQPPDSTITTYLEAMQRAGHRAKDLVAQILAFARRGQSARAPVKVARIMHEVVELMQVSAPQTVEIRCDITADELYVEGDATQLHQVLLNLGTNAHQAMAGAGGSLTFSLGQASSAPDVLEIQVRDTGPGIAEEIADRVFEPFFSTKKARQGTGLGLAVVHGIVTAHHGSIVLDTELGIGSTFTVRLPICAPPRAVEKTSRRVESARGDGARVLLVDDEAMIIDVLTRQLSRLDYDVAGFDDARQALSTFAADPDAFDLVMTDQSMPEISGMDLAAAIRERRPGIPIVLCTGWSDSISREDALRAGISEFLEKPLKRGVVAAAFQRLLAD